MVTLKIHDFGVLAGSLLLSAAAYGQTSTKNYVRTAVPMQPYTTPAALNTAMPDHTKVRVDIDYYDGLGRPLQGVASKAAPTAVDLVKPVAYDAVGRQDKSYMPYPAGTGNSFRTNAVTAQQTYYSGTAPAGQPTTSKAYAITVYDGSPLDRVKEQGFPGEVWQPAGSRTTSTGRTQASGFHKNNTEAYATVATMRRATRYAATLSTTGVPTLVNEGVYTVGQLTVAVTRNENWAGGSGTFASRLHTTEEYIDKLGHTVLRRTFNGTNEVLSTYYVYDNRGNLAFVLPPEVNPDKDSGLPTVTEMNNFAHQYRYDGLARLIEKKQPGRGWENYVYNPAGALIFHQEPRQQSETMPSFTPGQYHTFYKYDSQNRVILRGVERNRTWNREQIQNHVNTQPPYWEERMASGGYHGYSNVSQPQGVNDMYLLEANYYDDYSGIPGLPHNQSASYSKLTRGLLVASKAKVIGTTETYLWTVNYYDDEGRLVRQWKQHYLGGSSNANKFDDTINEYDFNGQLTKSTRKHHTTSPTTPAVIVVTEHTYDHRGRMVDTKKSVNGAAATTISRNAYNEVGQLRTKRLHSTNGTAWGQLVTYSYNTRGWVTTADAPLFKQVLGYNAGTAPQYNGNITSQAFTRHNLAATPALVTDTYTYTYDGAERLTQGAMAGNKGRETMTYSKNGNIKTLVRTGTNSTAVDNLTYTYTGNRLTGVADAATSTDANYQLPGTTGYTYDANGNVKTRVNTASTGNNLTAVTYNYLNLPQSVTAVAGNVTYTYDGSGRKLRSVGGIVGQTRDYIDGIEYVGGTMELIHHQEGRITRSGTIYTYHYFLKDHLGNNRVGFAQGTNVTSPNFTADFYPFGLQYRQYIRVGSPKINYLYSGKELQDGLKLYDFGSRFYDATTGRWSVPDPAEQYANPYLALGNNPVIYTDPNGEFAFLIKGLVDLVKTAFFKGGLDFTSKKSRRKAWREFDPSASWSQTNKALKIDMGMVKGNFGQVLSRFTWEHEQSMVGLLASQVHNLFGGVRSVSYYGGATAVESYSEWGGVTLGNYINGGRGLHADPGNILFQHEYGHYIQSQKSGPFYFSKYGIPSLRSKGTHNEHPVEQDANARAYQYFNKKFENFNEWNFEHNPILDFNHRVKLRWYDILLLPTNHLPGVNTMILNKDQ